MNAWSRYAMWALWGWILYPLIKLISEGCDHQKTTTRTKVICKSAQARDHEIHRTKVLTFRSFLSQPYLKISSKRRNLFWKWKKNHSFIWDCGVRTIFVAGVFRRNDSISKYSKHRLKAFYDLTIEISC